MFHARLRPVLRVVVLLAAAPFLTALFSVEAMLAPRAEPWPRWEVHDPDSTLVVDSGPWQDFLDARLVPGPDGINRVDYEGVPAPEREALRGWVASLAATPVDRLSRAAQRAYWINLYNALTVLVVLDNLPVDSITDIDISPGLLDVGPWDAPLIEVQGVSLTLNDIEHRILRPGWRDPRLHYALNCASLGCPNLQARAFTPDNAGAMLDAAARGFVNHPRAVRFAGDDLVVSSIYVWFAEDFGVDDRAVIDHLLGYAEPALARRLRAADRIDGHDYDWRLNRLP